MRQNCQYLGDLRQEVRSSEIQTFTIMDVNTSCYNLAVDRHRSNFDTVRFLIWH